MKRETHWHEIYISWAWKFKSIGMNFLHETFAEKRSLQEIQNGS